MDYNNKTTQILSNIRRAKRYTQKDVAQSLRITQSKFAKIETGSTQLDISRYFHICEILNIHPIKTLNKVFSQDLNEESNNGIQSNSNMDFAKQNYFKELILEKDRRIKQLEKSLDFLRSILLNNIKKAD